MVEVEWWDYDDAAGLAEAVAGDARFLIDAALDARGDAAVALPGGSVPLAALDQLQAARLKWRQVTIIPTDERLVSVEDKRSNARLLAERFLPLGARVVPLTSGDLNVSDAGAAADARLQALHWPLDLVWLHVGDDGHIAALYPGPDLEQALTASERAIGLTPVPLPADAPMPRVTLTASAILAARAILVSGSGADLRARLERAIADGASAQLPIGRVLAAAQQAIDIHWCP